MSAEVTRPPEDGDIALPETQAQFRAGGARYVLPDNHGIQGVAHRVGLLVNWENHTTNRGQGTNPTPTNLTPPRSGALLRGCTSADAQDPANPRTGCEGWQVRQRADRPTPYPAR